MKSLIRLHSFLLCLVAICGASAPARELWTKADSVTLFDDFTYGTK